MAVYTDVAAEELAAFLAGYDIGELLAPVESPELKAEIQDTLERCFADDTFAWELGDDWRWRRRGGDNRCVHRELQERALERATPADQ